MSARRFFVAVLLAGALLPAAGHGGELLINPDFSGAAAGHVAAGWHDGSTALPAPPAYAGVPGGRGQRITVRSLNGGRCRLVQTLAPVPAGLYRLRVKLRAAYPMQVQLVLRTSARPWTSYGSVREDLPAGAWREVTGYARLPAGRGPLDFAILLQDAGILDVAYASLQPVDEAAMSADQRARMRHLLGPRLPVVDRKALLAGIDARIREYRTAPLTVQVVDATGRPVPHAAVRLDYLRHLFWFGAGFDWNFLHPDRSVVDRYHREAFLRLFNSATVEFDSNRYEPAPGNYRDNEVMQALDWLEAHHLRARGHPLFWNLTTPRWLAAAAPTADRAKQWMDRLLAHTSDMFLPRFAQVDVFNEVVAWDRYDTPLTPVLAGSKKAAVMADFLRRFKALNPDTAAMVNDYDTTPAYYWLLRSVIDDGGGLDAIGLQSHMQNGVWSVTEIWNILNRLALLKLPIYFTELSVVSGAPRAFNFRPADPPWPTTPKGEAAQAAYLALFYRLAYSHPAVAGITYWSYSDRSAWLGCPVGLLRKDGSPKPAYWRLDHLINREWTTRGEYHADAHGQLVIPHAFEGEYRISADGASVRGSHSPGNPLNTVLVVNP